PSVRTESRFCSGSARKESWDRRGLALVYCEPPSGVAVSLRGAHVTARPVFYGAVPVAWIGAGLTQDPSAVAAAYRLTLSQGLTYGLVVGMKHAVGRPRPYVNLSLDARADRHRPPPSGDAYLSFPSGHASLSTALATSWSLSHPRWYVIAPGALWAAGVTLSRLYLGVHYPSDVLVGAAIGAGMAVLVHQVRAIVTPPPFRASGPQLVRTPPITIRLRF
ncbi:MAG: phosphatase PAP2 family protein, partial [Salinibacter sp.]